MKGCYEIPAEDLGRDAKISIRRFGASEEVYAYLAQEIADVIRRNNALGKQTAIICPVGPVGQYPILVKMVNDERISLKSCWFFNMDEYLDADGNWISEGHRLSFRGYMNREVYAKIDPALVMPEAQRVFPDPQNPMAYTEKLAALGGADLCVGGIGINGHLAFNEPQPELTAEAFAVLKARVLRISPETVTANAIDAMGGDIEDMPRQCVTAGMSEILGARRIRIGVFRVWHRAVVRRAAYDEVSAAFPATLLQRHADAVIAVNGIAVERP